jgi:hypothetical protein
MTRLPRRTAGVRAFSLGCLVAQRDAGRGVGAPGSRILLRPWGLVADVSFAAVFPGMAACRVPDCQVILAGARPRPGIQIEDIGGIQIVLAGVPPLASAPRSAIDFAVRMTDPVRHAAVDEDAGPANPGCPCRRH